LIQLKNSPAFGEFISTNQIRSTWDIVNQIVHSTITNKTLVSDQKLLAQAPKVGRWVLNLLGLVGHYSIGYLLSFCWEVCMSSLRYWSYNFSNNPRLLEHLIPSNYSWLLSQCLIFRGVSPFRIRNFYLLLDLASFEILSLLVICIIIVG
jgi:hypothetical protein